MLHIIMLAIIYALYHYAVRRVFIVMLIAMCYLSPMLSFIILSIGYAVRNYAVIRVFIVMLSVLFWQLSLWWLLLMLYVITLSDMFLQSCCVSYVGYHLHNVLLCQLQCMSSAIILAFVYCIFIVILLHDAIGKKMKQRTNL